MAITIQEGVPLAPLTTFQIGGSARYFTDVRNESEVREAISWAKERAMPYVMLAGGSNVLVPDGGLDALVLHVVGGEYSFDQSNLSADFGGNLLFLIRTASGKGLGGWEKLAGIPGTIGGAVRGNAGAFGSEIRDFVVTVRAYNPKTDEVRDFSNTECQFAYRNSFFKQNPDWIITTVSLQLQEVDSTTSLGLIEETIQERERRHLQNVQAAGSFFMNPIAPPDIVALFEAEKQVKSREGRVPAGWLIEKAGLKGEKVGGAQASMQHPNYIVNTGGATSHDVCNLAQMIKLEIYNQFGVELQEEAAIL